MTVAHAKREEHAMINPATETLVTLRRAAGHYPMVNGRHPHPSTVFRHALRGVDGIRLDAIRVGGRLVTSIEAVERFVKATTDPDPRVMP